MKFTFSWLKEHLDTTASLDEVVYALTDLGLEVEEVSDPIKKLNDFTIGKILKPRNILMRINYVFVKSTLIMVRYK